MLCKQQRAPLVLTACSLTEMHWEFLRTAATPPLSVFLMMPFLCRERWLPPSRPPSPRHSGGREILGVNKALTAPLDRRREGTTSGLRLKMLILDYLCTRF